MASKRFWRTAAAASALGGPCRKKPLGQAAVGLMYALWNSLRLSGLAMVEGTRFAPLSGQWSKAAVPAAAIRRYGGDPFC